MQFLRKKKLKKESFDMEKVSNAHKIIKYAVMMNKIKHSIVSNAFVEQCIWLISIHHP